MILAGDPQTREPTPRQKKKCIENETKDERKELKKMNKRGEKKKGTPSPPLHISWLHISISYTIYVCDDLSST